MSADNDTGLPVSRHRMHDGTPFEIHPCIAGAHPFTRAQWRAELQRGMRRLSPRSRWQRFASGIHELSEQQLDALTDVDGLQRVALCAVIPRHEGYEGIGIARYVVLTDEQQRIAEFALTVIDRWQAQGVGSALLQRLSSVARDNGIETLRGFVFASNAAMLALCRRHNAAITAVDGVLQADLVLRGAEPTPVVDGSVRRAHGRNRS